METNIDAQYYKKPAKLRGRYKTVERNQSFDLQVLKRGKPSKSRPLCRIVVRAFDRCFVVALCSPEVNLAAFRAKEWNYCVKKFPKLVPRKNVDLSTLNRYTLAHFIIMAIDDKDKDPEDLTDKYMGDQIEYLDSSDSDDSDEEIFSSSSSPSSSPTSPRNTKTPKNVTTFSTSNDETPPKSNVKQILKISSRMQYFLCLCIINVAVLACRYSPVESWYIYNSLSPRVCVCVCVCISWYFHTCMCISLVLSYIHTCMCISLVLSYTYLHTHTTGTETLYSS
ncbi:hypothetical protein OAV88_03985 [bacterium]|nr:hypothetical protein [bacterium]